MGGPAVMSGHRPAVVEDLGDNRCIILGVDAPKVDTEANRVAVDARAADATLLVPENKARSTARLPADAPVAIGCPDSLAINRQRSPGHARGLGASPVPGRLW